MKKYKVEISKTIFYSGVVEVDDDQVAPDFDYDIYVRSLLAECDKPYVDNDDRLNYKFIMMKEELINQLKERDPEHRVHLVEEYDPLLNSSVKSSENKQILDTDTILLYEVWKYFPEPIKNFNIITLTHWINNIENQLGINISKEDKIKAEDMFKENIKNKDDSYFPSYFYIYETLSIFFIVELNNYLFDNYYRTFMPYVSTMYDYSIGDENPPLGVADRVGNFYYWLERNEKYLRENYVNRRFNKE